MNFVITDTANNVVIFETKTKGSNFTVDGYYGFLMNEEGEIRIIVNNWTVWLTKTKFCGRYLMLQDDGNLVVYGQKNHICWSS